MSRAPEYHIFELKNEDIENEMREYPKNCNAN